MIVIIPTLWLRKLTSRGQGAVWGCGLQELQWRQGSQSPGDRLDAEVPGSPHPSPATARAPHHPPGRQGCTGPQASHRVPEASAVGSVACFLFKWWLMIWRHHIARTVHSLGPTREGCIYQDSSGLTEPRAWGPRSSAIPTSPGSSQDPQSEQAAGRSSGLPQPLPAPEGRMGYESTAWQPTEQPALHRGASACWTAPQRVRKSLPPWGLHRVILATVWHKP